MATVCQSVKISVSWWHLRVINNEDLDQSLDQEIVNRCTTVCIAGMWCQCDSWTPLEI